MFKRIILLTLFALLIESASATRKDIMVVSELEKTTEMNLKLESRMFDEELCRSIEETVDFDQQLIIEDWMIQNTIWFDYDHAGQEEADKKLEVEQWMVAGFKPAYS